MPAAVAAPQAPFFSVCLPTYNRADVPANASRSVLGQDSPDVEDVWVESLPWADSVDRPIALAERSSAHFRWLFVGTRRVAE
jgi:hypothetical protein